MTKQGVLEGPPTSSDFERLAEPSEKRELVTTTEKSAPNGVCLFGGDLPPGMSPPSKLDLGPLEVHSRG